jgi:uncharacterized protein YggE
MDGNKTRKIWLPTRSLVPRRLRNSPAVTLEKMEGEMMKRLLTTSQLLALVLATATLLHAQEAKPTDKRTRVTVGGDSIIQAQPDTAILTVAVVTQGKRAIDAQQENATKTDAVVRALKAAAGSGAEIKTSGYSLQPVRVYREGQPPLINGYEVRNAVTVTTGELAKLGNVIDAASQAGANDVTGISFTLRQDRAAREQALKEATQEAMSKAHVVAQALGGRVLGIAEVQEEGLVRPQPYYPSTLMAKSAEVTTPIEVGSLDVTSRVQLVAIVELNM